MSRKANRIELSLSPQYVEKWGLWEGVREIFQNAFDAGRDGHKFSCRYDRDKQELHVINDGVCLSPQMLLLGNTTKADREDQLGQFGEGLKLGLLVLTRCGVPIRILNGAWRWIPSFVFSSTFEGNVLAVEVRPRTVDSNRFEVIMGISPDEWEMVRGRILTKRTRGAHWDAVSTGGQPRGSILLDRPGDIFIGNLWVKHEPKFKYGYNFAPGLLELNRDRNAYDQGELHSAIAKVWGYCLDAPHANREVRCKALFELLRTSEHGDLGHTDWWAQRVVGITSTKSREALSALYSKQYGATTIPYHDEHSKSAGEAYGLTMAMVTPQIAGMMWGIHGTRDELLQRTAEQNTNVTVEIEGAELFKLKRALALLEAAGIFIEKEPLVVHFAGATLEGTYTSSEDQIRIAHRVLQQHDLSGLLCVLIHEHSHREGADYTRGHTEAMERNWAKLVQYLLDRDLQL